MPAPGAGAFVANYLRFRSYDSSVKKAGTFRYNWSLNNVQMPQYSADIMDALADVNYLPDKVGVGSQGTLITSKESSFNDGKFVCGQLLNTQLVMVWVLSRDLTQEVLIL
jgi:hypothetical protein